MLRICKIGCPTILCLGSHHSKNCVGIIPMSHIWEFLVPNLGPEYHLTRGRPSKPKVANAFCWDMKTMQNLQIDGVFKQDMLHWKECSVWKISVILHTTISSIGRNNQFSTIFYDDDLLHVSDSDEEDQI